MQVCEGGWERVHARRWGVGSMAAARPGGSLTRCPDRDPDMDPDRLDAPHISFENASLGDFKTGSEEKRAL